MKKYIDAEKLLTILERQNVDKKVIEPIIRIIESLQQEQSFLSSDLDEAAEKYYFSPACSWEDHEERFINAFKAGAEWAIQQLKVK